jgi:hypothetical protein
MASVHVIDWGDASAAHDCVLVGLGLSDAATRQLLDGSLPVSVLCEAAQAEAFAAFVAELGGKVDVTHEGGLGVRLLTCPTR